MLSDIWRDIISIGGFLLTFAGLLYTMRQVWLAKSAAEAAKDAAEKALAESLQKYRHYTASLAHRFINEARSSIENAQWSLATIRLTTWPTNWLSSAPSCRSSRHRSPKFDNGQQPVTVSLPGN
jgi:hypothetical protein